MAQIFHPSMNAIARGTIFGGVLLVAAVAWAGSVWVRSSYVTQADVVRDQPVPFSHDHHVSGLGLDCRYCHTSVEKSAFAGIPSTEICMGCHSQIWNRSPLLAPVRQSLADNRPLEWTRVTDLPDFVYFNHRIHVAKGIGCESCHGRVDRMPLMRKANAMHMEWCLDCHRHPDAAVRPPDEIYRFGLKDGDANALGSAPEATHGEVALAGGESEAKQLTPQTHDPPAADKNDQAALVREYGIAKTQLTDCVICHR